jgi:peptidoglycan/xylan/chitin deacetylase (PgdA/CDA1 family)
LYAAVHFYNGDSSVAYEKQYEDVLMRQGLQEKDSAELHDSDSIALSRRLYYAVKPLLPNRLRLLLRRQLARAQKKKYAPVWPIYAPAAARPAGWAGWPGGKRFALLLTHDVDSPWGNENVPRLIELEQSLGFTSTFFFVPEWYDSPDRHHELLRSKGFEIGVHGLKHDGKLYQSEKVFNQNAERINDYISRWGAAGFRAPCMHHNLAWHHRLHIQYDASTYDTDPFEPQGGGAGTIFPFKVTDGVAGHSYIELPYTLPQDYLLFILLQMKTVNIWKRKLDWVAAKGGMVHFITHPDYMSFKDNGCNEEKYPALFYREILSYIQESYAGQYWPVTAKELADYWRSWQG